MRATPETGLRPLADESRPTTIATFGHSWAAGTNVRRSKSWPVLVADRLQLRRRRLRMPSGSGRTNFSRGGARATGPASEHGAGWVLQALPSGPRTAPSLVLLLTGDLDIERHGGSEPSRRLLAGGIRAALGRLMADEVHEEDEDGAWSFGPGWRRVRGDGTSSGHAMACSTLDGAAFTIRLPGTYDGTPVAVGLPFVDGGTRGTIAWDVDGRPLGRCTDLSAMQRVLTPEYPQAVYAERFPELPPGATALRGRWTTDGDPGAGVVVDYWSLERSDVPVLCALMPDRNPWGATFGGITATSNRANREALAEYRDVLYVDLARAVCPTGTDADRQYWDSDASSHLSAAGERAVADLVVGAVGHLWATT